MNYLAHAYLSFNQPEILLGNMISDFVKGKTKLNYPLVIQKGIALHRAIDEFTDTHAETQKAKEFFRPAYRLYSGAFVDVVYDHFLAQDKNEFPDDKTLANFCNQTYTIIETNLSILPQNFQRMFPYMQKDNWLYNYRLLSGMEKGFGGLVRRAKYMHESASAFTILNKYFYELNNCYTNFFPGLKLFAANYLANLPVE